MQTDRYEKKGSKNELFAFGYTGTGVEVKLLPQVS